MRSHFAIAIFAVIETGRNGTTETCRSQLLAEEHTYTIKQLVQEESYRHVRKSDKKDAMESVLPLNEGE